MHCNLPTFLSHFGVRKLFFMVPLLFPNNVPIHTEPSRFADLPLPASYTPYTWFDDPPRKMGTVCSVAGDSAVVADTFDLHNRTHCLNVGALHEVP